MGISATTLRRSNTWYSFSGSKTTLSASFNGNVMTVSVQCTATGSGSTTGSADMFVNGSGTAIETISLAQGSTAEPFTVTKSFTTAFTAYSTVRITASISHSYTGGPDNLTFDQTFTVNNLSSLTGPLVLTSSQAPIFYFASGFTSASNILHFKNTRITGSSAFGDAMYFLNATIDDDTTALQLSGAYSSTGATRAGITLVQSEGGGRTFYIASVYRGSLAGSGTAVSPSTAITTPIVLADITSGGKALDLPDPATFGSRYLCICGYTTGTSTSNILTVNHKDYFEIPDSIRSATAYPILAGPSIGLFLVSDGTKWYLMGLFRGSDTVFDIDGTAYTALTRTIGLANASPTNGCSTGISPLSDSGVFQMWKIKTTIYNEGATVQNTPNNAVNSNYRRWYHKRSDGAGGWLPNYSAYVFVHTKVGSGGTPTIFPVALYPSEN